MSSRKSFDDRAFDVVNHMRSDAIARGVYVDEVCITRGEIARKFDISRTHAARLLTRMVDEGMMVDDYVYPHSSSRLGVVQYWLSERACDAIFSQSEISWGDVTNE